MTWKLLAMRRTIPLGGSRRFPFYGAWVGLRRRPAKAPSLSGEELERLALTLACVIVYAFPGFLSVGEKAAAKPAEEARNKALLRA